MDLRPAGAVLCALACACLLVAAQDSPDIIKYHVVNEAEDMEDWRLFTRHFGEGRMEQIMSEATAAVWETFGIDHYPENTNYYEDVYLTVKILPSIFTGQAASNKIDLNSGLFFVWNLEGKMEAWVQSVVYHEITHVWQKDIKGLPRSTEERALREGTAHYVAMRAGHAPPNCRHQLPHVADRSWRDGYCPTAFFLRYLSSATRGGDGIVGEINRRLNDHGYLEDDFVDLLGSTPDELWQQYLATLPGLGQVAGGQAGKKTLDRIYIL